MTDSSKSQRSVYFHFNPIEFGPMPFLFEGFQKSQTDLHGPHCMGTGRADSDFEHIQKTDHLFTPPVPSPPTFLESVARQTLHLIVPHVGSEENTSPKFLLEWHLFAGPPHTELDETSP